MTPWIKIEINTPDKPEIVRMADILGLDPDAVFGKCFRIWAWADMNCINGDAVSVTEAFLDRLAYHQGFAEAMRKVGWLEGGFGKTDKTPEGGVSSGLRFPRFERHNGQSAKKRALTAGRMSKMRGSCDANGDANVTHGASPEGGAKASPDKSKSTLGDKSPKERTSDLQRKKAENIARGMKFAEWFRELLRDTGDERPITKKDLENWAETYDLMVRVDKRPVAEIAKLCEWARKEEFWSTRFLSPCKLRLNSRDKTKFYDVILGQMKAERKRDNPSPPPPAYPPNWQELRQRVAETTLSEASPEFIEKELMAKIWGDLSFSMQTEIIKAWKQQS